MRRNMLLFMKIIAGAALLSPLVGRLPMIGWDWYYFFNRYDPVYNLTAAASAYPPYTVYFIEALTWMDWRRSLSYLNALTLVTIAIATWLNGGRYGSIVMALLSPPVWFLMWIGHPDGLALLGLVINFIPLALIKPQLTIFSLFSRKRRLVWTLVFLCLTLLVWPAWPLRLGSATLTHEAAFGWIVSGWPVLVLGVILLLGAGTHPYRLMAAGLLVSPYLMPYNLAVLLPAIGQVRGYRQVLIWASAWLVLLGVGLPWPAKYLSLVFPLAVYFLTHSFSAYVRNVAALVKPVKWLASQ